MTWVRRADPGEHACRPPTAATWGDPLGRYGDLWRCPCGTLWRIGDACDFCDRFGWGPHQGGHAVGETWRPATLWQRIRHYRKGRP
ncbi:hypothetical protein AB0O28_18985 [Microbispora sp. NPDC088329]|uniref:hypothetical protein n=1 Tax=Microbispora sp. NPDC088329 TaxID=3154869 RepID=UPI00343301CF